MADQRPQPIEPPSGPEKEIEVKRQIFVEKIRHGAYDCHWNTAFMRHGCQCGTLHVEADRAREIAYGPFLIGSPDDSWSRHDRTALHGYPGFSPDGKQTKTLVLRARSETFSPDPLPIMNNRIDF